VFSASLPIVPPHVESPQERSQSVRRRARSQTIASAVAAPETATQTAVLAGNAMQALSLGPGAPFNMPGLPNHKRPGRADHDGIRALSTLLNHDHHRTRWEPSKGHRLMANPQTVAATS
jgi:hypothetical protein